MLPLDGDVAQCLSHCIMPVFYILHKQMAAQTLAKGYKINSNAHDEGIDSEDEPIIKYKQRSASTQNTASASSSNDQSLESQRMAVSDANFKAVNTL
jgi:hypothetical protein